MFGCGDEQFREKLLVMTGHVGSYKTFWLTETKDKNKNKEQS